jgi:hypothetical protein
VPIRSHYASSHHYTNTTRTAASTSIRSVYVVCASRKTVPTILTQTNSYLPRRHVYTFSIMVSYYGYDTEGQVGYNEEAVLQMVAAAAPRLKSLRMWSCISTGASLAFRDATRAPRPLWQCFLVANSGESPGLTRAHQVERAAPESGSAQP